MGASPQIKFADESRCYHLEVQAVGGKRLD